MRVKHAPIPCAFTVKCTSKLSGCGGAAAHIHMDTHYFYGNACEDCADAEMRKEVNMSAEWTLAAQNAKE
jgi:hypothetical protein